MTGPASGPPAVPRATVRLQFSKDFTFEQTAGLAPYFARLGVSHIYASPFLQARSGSTHGYDIIDHSQFNREIGDAAAFEAMVAALHEHGLGLILDFVPNHMGVGGSDNVWWLDVLEWGQASPYAPFFAIDWHPAEPALHGKVLLPILGDQYGDVMERGELELRFDAERGSFSVWYYAHRLPIAVRHYPRILRPVQEALGDKGAELAPIIAGFVSLAAAGGMGGRSVQRQSVLRRQAEEMKGKLATLAAGDAEMARAIQRAVERLNGRPGRPETFRDLHRLLEEQHYRAAFWRVASDEINYRRFFDVNDLAGLAIERPELFELAHQLVFRLIGEGKLQGVRLDHVDGLFDPIGYCEKLQDRAAYLTLQAGVTELPGLHLDHPFYVVVEKILAAHEHLRADWPVSGTTGYDVMNHIGGLFVDTAAEGAFTEAYHRFIEEPTDYETAVVEAKRQILRTSLAAELNVVAGELHRLAGQSWSTRDYTLTSMRRALADVIAWFPVYRTYIRPDTSPGHIAEDDRRILDWAIGRARRHTDAPDTTIYDFLYAALSTDLGRNRQRGYRPADVMATALRFQQITGPVMAKSLEDTVFYRYARLISLNEVGGEPGHFGNSPTAFHAQNQERLRRFPFALLSTATHDHKRGEDTRVRIHALTEMAEVWTHHARRWSRVNRYKKREIEGRPAPDANDEYFLYQTLVGSWPLDDRGKAGGGASGLPEDYADRIAAYMLKAVREAKRRSSWAAANADYEDALERFVRGILDPVRGASFLADFRQFHRRVAVVGAVNGLAQTLLRLTVPGVPDLYQGTEFWDLSLVDPDNRRPVDWPARSQSLEAPMDTDDLVRSWRDGRIKQHVIARTLALRQREPALFAVGDYGVVEAVGAEAGRVVAFLRRQGGVAALVVAPRLVAPLLAEADVPLPPAESWADTTLLLPEMPEAQEMTDLLGGQTHPLPADGRMPVGRLLNRLPVALLVPSFLSA
ncbi:MAG TPA: malto-oligosyltrehalose synthase [Azospirillaceae bacterium]|nr:malto-oligosyltrehalose synthase [Azospirillaceae bacterium]